MATDKGLRSTRSRYSVEGTPQTEPPFLVAQLVVLVFFAGPTVTAARRCRLP